MPRHCNDSPTSWPSKQEGNSAAPRRPCDACLRAPLGPDRLMSNNGRHRVVVIGGGFGGLQAVHRLRGADVDVTLVDRRNFHLFQPLSYQVATGALSAAEVCFPLRWIFRRHRNVRVLMAEVTDFDLDGRAV